MNDVQHYLINQLKIPDYQLTHDEMIAIQKSGVVPYLIKKIMANKYRKSAATTQVIGEVVKRVRLSVKENLPIHLTIPTGGYKKWQFESAPDVDWAEFFHLHYMIQYMAPMAAAYPPGVVLDYFSNCWLVKIISHYPQSDLERYTKSFCKLIDNFNEKLPSNIKIRYNVVSDQIPEEELLRRTLKNRPSVEMEWKTLTEEEKTKRLKYSERNIRWDILEKNQKLGNIEREKIIYEGKIIHDSLLKGGWNNDLFYLRSNYGIAIIHRNSDPYFLHLATLAGSFVQFWVGTGIIEKRQGKLIPRVLSYNQYDKVREKLQKVVVDIPEIGDGNFNVIEVLSE